MRKTAVELETPTAAVTLFKTKQNNPPLSELKRQAVDWEKLFASYI